MKNILVVDDDRDLCDLISEIVSDEGFSVQKAYNGFAALEKMNKFNFDLLIIDNRLAGLSGISVLENIQRKKVIPKTIMMSAYGNKRIKNLARDFGVVKFIDKPFDIAKLINIVNKVLNSIECINLSFIF